MDVGKEKESSWAALEGGLHIMLADGCCIPGFFDQIRIPGRKKALLCPVLLAFRGGFFLTTPGGVMEGGKYSKFHPTITTEIFL